MTTLKLNVLNGTDEVTTPALTLHLLDGKLPEWGESRAGEIFDIAKKLLFCVVSDFTGEPFEFGKDTKWKGVRYTGMEIEAILTHNGKEYRTEAFKLGRVALLEWNEFDKDNVWFLVKMLRNRIKTTLSMIADTETVKETNREIAG
jgi:hypothetical protein